MDVEALVGRVIEAAGLELVEVTFRKEGTRRVLRVTIDREGGVDLDTISETSERISRRLDLEGFASGPYSFEVSSPGIERPLRKPSDFERRVGQQIRVKTASSLEGSRTHTGALISADEDAIVIASEGGQRRIPHEDIASAHPVADWAEELKGSNT